MNTGPNPRYPIRDIELIDLYMYNSERRIIPKKSSELQVYYQSEDEYVDFTWRQFQQGHKICKIIHLPETVKIIVKLYERLFFNDY